MIEAVEVDELDGYVSAYRQAKAKQSELEAQVATWKEAADTLGNLIAQTITAHPTENVDGSKKIWVGTVNGKRVIRVTSYIEHRVNVKALREKEPEIADRFEDHLPRIRLTLL